MWKPKSYLRFPWKALEEIAKELDMTVSRAQCPFGSNRIKPLYASRRDHPFGTFDGPDACAFWHQHGLFE